jgi:hypothetical protein
MVETGFLCKVWFVLRELGEEVLADYNLPEYGP